MELLAAVLPLAFLALVAWAITGFHKDRRRIDREHEQWVEENYGKPK